MRRLLALVVPLSLLLSSPASAAPTGWATPNITPRAHVQTLGAGVGGAFYGRDTYVLSVADEVWNYTNVAATVTGGLEVFDVTTPEDPVRKGWLPLPNYQNEDVQVSVRRRLAVMSQDVSGRVTLVDLTDTRLPTVLSTLLLPTGYGHTATLVDGDRYLWVSGGQQVLVVDIRDLRAPAVLGTFPTPAGERGPAGYSSVHDVAVDRFGDVTVYGGGGTAVHRLTDDPLQPRLVARTVGLTKEQDGLIHHGGMRLDRTTWLLTEEDYSSGCDDDGSLQVWKLRGGELRFLSAWDAPRGADADRGVAAQDYCSSHWFDVNRNNVVADGWYAAGARFLDYSDPAHPRPIGTWAGDSTTASQALFFPGRDDLVYVADYARGLDVVSIAKGGRGARTARPQDEQRVGSAPGVTFQVKLQPHARFGWACATPY